MASGSSLCILKCPSSSDTVQDTIHDCDYNHTKAVFNQEIDYVIPEKKYSNKVLRQKEDIDKVISELKQNKVHHKVYFKEKCSLVNENGKDTLCQVITKFNGKAHYVANIKQILCLDEMFDILYELHLQKPYLDEAKIIEHLKHCLVFEAIINLFLHSCKSCYTIGKKIDTGYFRLIAEISVIRMYHPDGNFTNIFMYIERNTNYVILRPIKSLSHTELAYEMLTIFSDFGSPVYINSDMSTHILKYNDILTIWKALKIPFRGPTMFIKSKIHKIGIIGRRVREMLNKWMQKTGSSNWAIGAHVVQWQMNTSKVVDTYIRSRIIHGIIHSPYHAMFGLLPHLEIIKIKEKRQPAAMLSKEKVLVDCSQCSLPIYKVFRCHFCETQCHFSCCVRYVEQTPNGAIFINKCLSCTNTDIPADEEMILGT